MATIPAIDFTSRDEEGIREEMIVRKPFLTPEWTDDNDSDLGNALIDEFVAALSVLHYYIDRAAGEGFVLTAIKRESLEKLFFFWNIPGKSSASVTLKFSIQQNQGQDVDIPSATELQTISNISPVFFETDSLLTLKYELLTGDTNGTDIVSVNSTNFVIGQTVEIGDDDTASIQRTIIAIPGGTSIQVDSVVPTGYTTAQNAFCAALTGTVGAIEGKIITEAFNNSDGSAFQRRRSTSTDIVDDTISYIIDEGGGDVTWSEVETFYSSISSDLHFITKRKWDGTVELILGNDSQGKIPVATATLTMQAREGVGVQGNVGIGTIIQINDQITVGGIPINITVTNEAAATGGSDAMDNEEAKIRGAEEIRVNDRYISTNDYIVGARSTSGVGQAQAVRVAQPGASYNVAIYIIPEGGGLPSALLKATVKADLELKGSIRVVPEVFDPGLARIAIGGIVYVLSNYIQATVQVAVEFALANFFAVNNLEFGKAIRESDISRAIDSVTGVDYVDITKLTLIPRSADIDLTRWSGNAVWGDVVIGVTVISEIWTVTFTTPTTFNVRGSVSGIQSGTGVLDIQYVSDNGEVTFTIASGVTPMVVGDNASFRTSDYRGNVLVLEDEIAILDTNDLTYSGGG